MKNYTFVDYATQIYSALVGLLILIFHNQALEHWPLLIAAHAAGLVAVHFLVRFAGSSSSKTLDFLRHFYPVLLYTWFFCETGWLDRMIFPEVLDPTVIRWEQAIFGCQPAVIFMEQVPYAWFSEILYASYFSYYLMISGVALLLFLRNREQFFHYISVVSFLFYLCYLIYIFLPVIGPRVFFGEIAGFRLPADLQQLAPAAVTPASVTRGPFYHLMAWIYATFESPGAALPSSHVAVALCTLYFSFRYALAIRFVHFVLVVLLCFSTVYCRYHYGVDVLAGIATAAVVLPLGNWLYSLSAKKLRRPRAPEPIPQGALPGGP